MKQTLFFSDYDQEPWYTDDENEIALENPMHDNEGEQNN